MGPQELRNLQEAYEAVYENQQLDEISQKLATSVRDKARKSELEHRMKAHDKIKATKNIPFVSDVGRAMAQPDIDKANRRARQANLADRKLGGSGQYGYDSKGNYGKEGPAKVLATKDKKTNGESAAQKARKNPEFKKQLIKDRMKTMSNESYDIYDIILSHLLDEGYAETPRAPQAIMVNMSEVWREDIIDEAYVDYRKGKLPSGRTPQTALKSGVERAKVNASREQRAGGSSGTTATPSWKRSKKADAVGREMDAHTGLGGKINKALSPGLGNRPGAGPRVAYGEPNTARHQGARYRRGQSSTSAGNSKTSGATRDLPFFRSAN